MADNNNSSKKVLEAVFVGRYDEFYRYPEGVEMPGIWAYQQFYQDENGNIIRPDDIDQDSTVGINDKTFIPIQLLPKDGASNGTSIPAVYRWLKLIPGCVYPIPAGNRALLEITVNSGQFAKAELSDKVTRMYAQGKSGNEVWEAVKDSLITLEDGGIKLTKAEKADAVPSSELPLAGPDPVELNTPPSVIIARTKAGDDTALVDGTLPPGGLVAIAAKQPGD